MIASLNTMIVRRTHTPAKSVSYPWEVDWEAGETPVEHFWITDLKSSPNFKFQARSDRIFRKHIAELLQIEKIKWSEHHRILRQLL